MEGKNSYKPKAAETWPSTAPTIKGGPAAGTYAATASIYCSRMLKSPKGPAVTHWLKPWPRFHTRWSMVCLCTVGTRPPTGHGSGSQSSAAIPCKQNPVGGASQTEHLPLASLLSPHVPACCISIQTICTITIICIATFVSTRVEDDLWALINKWGSMYSRYVDFKM